MTLLPKVMAAALAALAVLAAPSAAQALEVHFAGDDVRVTVDAAGQARVEHALAYRVSGGALKGFDLTGIEPEAVLDPVAPVAVDGEVRNAAHVERKSDRALHVTMDPSQHLEKGHPTLLVRVGYTVDLVQARELVSDGAMWRLAWSAPVAPEGYDAARVVLDLPAAPTEPRAAAADGTVSDDGRVVTLRRGQERDELEMARPHVARGEAAAWMARVDPRAFPRVSDPSLRPPAPVAENQGQGRAWWTWLLALVAGIAFGAVASAKTTRFARACTARGVVAKGLVSGVPAALRAWMAGGRSRRRSPARWGICRRGGRRGDRRSPWRSLRIARPSPLVSPRGPGQWLALSPGDAFAPRTASADPLDVATRSGKWTLALSSRSAPSRSASRSARSIPRGPGSSRSTRSPFWPSS